MHTLLCVTHSNEKVHIKKRVILPLREFSLEVIKSCWKNTIIHFHTARHCVSILYAYSWERSAKDHQCFFFLISPLYFSIWVAAACQSCISRALAVQDLAEQ